ncbi:hypothetical protein FQR65_LT15339 [Abscondita terminalis]|nr:hypothetical protein FQR65_LT15339 [Abscondita terminalis]
MLRWSILPKVNNPSEFSEWLKGIKGKLVLMAQYQRSGRPDYQIKEFATPELYEKFKAQRVKDAEDFRTLIKNTGYDNNTLPEALEKAGAAGIAISNWTGIMGANRIFGAKTKNIPMIDIAVEDYGMLYRLAVNGKKPTIKVNAQSKNLGTAKSFNTIARIEGKEKPNEYVILSAHFDSWDGAQGATDNGTGHWGSEEQGLNGSRAFVLDNPEIIKNTQVAFNQDNGTGRVVNFKGQGFVDSYDYLTVGMTALPKNVGKHIETSFPGMPSGGGSDHASFVAAGVPGISLSSLNWGYFGYTWHTNRDTYDKIMFDEHPLPRIERNIFGDFPPKPPVLQNNVFRKHTHTIRPVVGCGNPVMLLCTTLGLVTKTHVPNSAPKPLTIFTTTIRDKISDNPLQTIIDTGCFLQASETTQFPAAKAGASFQTAISIGKFPWNDLCYNAQRFINNRDTGILYPVR